MSVLTVLLCVWSYSREDSCVRKQSKLAVPRVAQQEQVCQQLEDPRTDVENLQTSVGREAPTFRTRIEVIGVFAQIWALDDIGLFALDIIFGLAIILTLSLKMDWNREVTTLQESLRQSISLSQLSLSWGAALDSI